jgi:FAD/FMN-containing dehydrogenase
MSMTSDPITLSPADLADELSGAVLSPTHPGYDDGRRAWNLSIDQRPSAVVQPSSVQDVIAAVLVARQRGQRIAPQGTGHGAWPIGAMQDTMLLRTDRMRAVHVDPVAQIARIEPGAVWGDVVAAAAEHGLAAVAGVPDVGVAGYSLGGGLSFLSRRYGLACNRITAVELVTADGRWRRVDPNHDPELFWAVRGGGGNFGVVTAIEIALFELTEVYAGILWFGIDRASEVLAAFAELTRSELPDELTLVGRLLKFPPIPEIPEPMRGQSFAVIEAFHAGDPRVADEVLAPVRAMGPVMDTIATVPITQMAGVHMDPDHPSPVCGDGLMLADLTDEALDTLVKEAGSQASFPILSVEVRHLEGEVGRRCPGHGALGSIDARYAMYAVTVTPVRELEVAGAHAIASLKEAMRPWAGPQMYLNFSEAGDDPSTFWMPEDYDRLRAVKTAVDPEGLIRANHMIAPLAA